MIRCRRSSYRKSNTVTRLSSAAKNISRLPKAALRGKVSTFIPRDYCGIQITSQWVLRRTLGTPPSSKRHDTINVAWESDVQIRQLWIQNFIAPKNNTPKLIRSIPLPHGTTPLLLLPHRSHLRRQANKQ